MMQAYVRAAGSRSGYTGFGGGGRVLRLAPFFLAFVIAVMLALWPRAGADAANPISFDPAENYDAGIAPNGAVTGDFNRDGITDIATVNTSGNNVSVMLGAADGSFGVPANYDVGTGPVAITTADFNRDGILDLAVVNKTGWNVSILIGTSTGTFVAGDLYAAGMYPTCITTGDFNSDGKIDMAVGAAQGNNFAVYLGNGDGTFPAGENYPAPYGISSIVAGDFRHTGILDIAVASADGDYVKIEGGTGDGGFVELGGTEPVGGDPRSITSGDFNRDGITDLATANSAGNNVSVLIGLGMDDFDDAVNYQVGTYPYSITTSDFNGDGIPDLATANVSTNNVSVLPGIGDGTFGSGTNSAAASQPIGIVSADFNRDGKPDVATANNGSNDISVLINTTVFDQYGYFGPAVNYGAGTEPHSVATDDFNRDGILDLAVTETVYGKVYILLGAGGGTFDPAGSYDVGSSPQSVCTGDFNHDGKADLAVVNAESNNVSVLLGTGTGTFNAAVNYAVGNNPNSVATGDFNLDGNPDLAATNMADSNVSILLGAGDGTFGAASTEGTGSGPVSVAVGDFDRDGKPDLAVANYFGNDVSILLGTGTGTFAPAVNYDVGFIPYSVATGDLNSDGKPDLAVANYASNNVSVLLGTGTGTFGAATNFGAGSNSKSVTIGDLNVDGKLDLAVAHLGGSFVSVMLGTGTGSFDAPVNYGVGEDPYNVTEGDFNGDGKLDLAVPNSYSHNVSILLNRQAATTKAITGFTIPGQVGTTTIDETAHTVDLTMPYGTDVTALVPTITTTGVSVNPESGVAHDFTSPATYTVTAEDTSTQAYTVTVHAPTPVNYYWPWYDSANMANWVLMANPAGAGSNLQFGLQIAGNEKDPGDIGHGTGVVAPGETLAPLYPGLVGGPVKSSSITGDPAIVSQRSLMGNSFEEVPGFDGGDISDHMYWTWYDQQSPGFANWVLVANPSATETVHAIVSFINQADGQPVSAESDIAPGQSWTPTFPGKMGGPVELKAYLAGGSWPADARDVMASQRVLSNYGSAFNEVPGIPETDLSSDYLWTWYDQKTPGFADWVLMANPTSASGPVFYRITIAGELKGMGSISPGQKVTPTYAGSMGGPVEVKGCSDVFDPDGGCTGSPAKLIASQRVLAGPSFEEVPGYPQGQLAPDYHWTWYDMQSPGSANWILIANTNDTAITYQVKIAGQVMPTTSDNPGTIEAHSSVTPVFPGTMGGPVEVTATGGNVMVSQRVLWNGYFNEVGGTVLP